MGGDKKMDKLKGMKEHKWSKTFQLNIGNL